MLYTKQENQVKVLILIGLYRGLLAIAFVQIPLLYECAFLKHEVVNTLLMLVIGSQENEVSF